MTAIMDDHGRWIAVEGASVVAGPFGTMAEARRRIAEKRSKTTYVPIEPGQWVLTYRQEYCTAYIDGDMAGALERLVRRGSGWDTLRDARELFDVLRAVRVMPKTYAFNRPSLLHPGTMIDDRRHRSLVVAAGSSEGERAGVDNHRSYFRVYSDKANLAPPAEKSDWFKLESVELGNGDHVGVVVPWKWPDPFSDITVTDLKAVQRAIDGKKLRENSQAKDWAGNTIAEVLGIDPTEKSNRHKITSCIKTWVASGALRVSEIEDEKGKKRPILEVGEWA
jgi:hypothetical protein